MGRSSGIMTLACMEVVCHGRQFGKYRVELTREQKDEMWGDRLAIKTATLKLDDILTPPASWSPTMSVRPKLATPNPKGIYDHMVYSEETLKSIARQYGADTNVIMELNGITNSDTVKPGVRLLVPIPDWPAFDSATLEQLV